MQFYKITEIRQHKYYQIPKELYINPKYKATINNDAKVLYALLLDRMELSRTNGWIEGDGTIFLMFKREDLADMLGICMNTIIKAFKQLKEVKLIDERRQGLGRPNIIYIAKIETDNATSNDPEEVSAPSDIENLNVKSFKNQQTDICNNEVHDIEIMKSNNTEKNNTKRIRSRVNDNKSKINKADDKNINLLDSS